MLERNDLLVNVALRVIVNTAELSEIVFRSSIGKREVDGEAGPTV